MPKTSSATALVTLFLAASAGIAQRIEATVPSSKPLNGHLILVIAKTENPEPRNQLSETYDSAQGFGVDAENLNPRSRRLLRSGRL